MAHQEVEMFCHELLLWWLWEAWAAEDLEK